MMTSKDFLGRLTSSDFSHADRAVALLWYYKETGEEQLRSSSELAEDIESAGYPKQNASRLGNQLDRDQRVARKNGRYHINIKHLEEVQNKFEGFLGPKMPLPSDSILPLELFFDTRGYIEKVVRQANAAYDVALYDCCAVMLRRLIETLIIEVYEHEDRDDELKGRDNHYMFLSGLVSHIKSDSNLSLSRNGDKALDQIKKLGDLSAHNRRYNAVKNDIDRVRDGIRVVSQELMNLSGLR